ncbi:MAG: hypothetical protein JJT75_09115 [Opitutales bacterium]|nr:hypothetical protein [Opitutales bacterium]MCH8539262.1 hypothetical protein [Opitutales bacterium]
MALWNDEEEDSDWDVFEEDENEIPEDRGGALMGMKKWAVWGLLLVLVAFVGVRVLGPLLKIFQGE